jgi:hypothetical protein
MSAVTGKWLYNGEINGASWTCATILTADGQYGTYLKVSNAAGYFEGYQEEGTFTVNEKYIVLTPNNGSGSVGRQYEVRGTTLFVWFAEVKTWMSFRRCSARLVALKSGRVVASISKSRL